MKTGAVSKLSEKESNTALMLASSNGHTEIVQALITAKAEVNATNKYGWTALTLVNKKDRTAIVKLLKKAGARN